MPINYNEQVFYTVYIILNNFDDMYYIGTHITNNLDDRYLGSGTRLNHAKKKHGSKNFRREILKIFDNANDMFDLEEELVDPTDPLTYNIAKGGKGIFKHVRIVMTQEQLTARAQKALATKKARYTPEQISEWSNRPSEKRKNTKSFLGKTHTDEVKAKISEAASARVGEKNGSYKSKWMQHADYEKPKKVKSNDIAQHLLNGWKFGRGDWSPPHKNKTLLLASQELYEMSKNKSMSQIAREFGVHHGIITRLVNKYKEENSIFENKPTREEILLETYELSKINTIKEVSKILNISTTSVYERLNEYKRTNNLPPH